MSKLAPATAKPNKDEADQGEDGTRRFGDGGDLKMPNEIAGKCIRRICTGKEPNRQDVGGVSQPVPCGYSELVEPTEGQARNMFIHLHIVCVSISAAGESLITYIPPGRSF